MAGVWDQNSFINGRY